MMNKRFKKGTSIILTGVLMCSFAGSALAVEDAQAKLPAVIDKVQTLGVSQMYGTILSMTKENDLTMLEVKFADKDDTMIFYVGEETFVVDAMTGLPMDLAGKENTTVSVYYGPAVTMSLPAQSPATAVIGNIDQDAKFPLYAKVEDVRQAANGDGIQITTNNGSRIITLPKDIAISPYLTKNIVTIDDVVKDAEVLLWYDIMTLSMPAQATADKAILLRVPESSEEIAYEPLLETAETPVNTMTITSDSVTAFINGQEIPLNHYINEQGEMMVPARTVSEALGYDVLWNEGTVILTIKDGARSATYTIGSTDYALNRMRLQLKSAPENKDGVTYVPISFIVEALETEVTIDGELLAE